MKPIRLIAALFLALVASPVDSLRADPADRQALVDTLVSLNAERVKSWKENRQASIDGFVARGATPEEAAAAIDDLIAMGEAGVRDGLTSLPTTTNKLDALQEKIAIIAAVSNLDGKRLDSFVAANGVKPSSEFLNCLCPSRFWYAPSPAGECEGRTVAYATRVFEPMSRDPKVWTSCARAFAPTLLDDIAAKVKQMGQRYDRDVCDRLRTVLDEAKVLMAQGQLKAKSESIFSKQDFEKSFFDLVWGAPVTGVTEASLGTLSDKFAIRTGIVEQDAPTGLGFFLTDGNQPSVTGLNNPYVAETKILKANETIRGDGAQLRMSYEMALARRIALSPGNLAPGDVFRMAVDITKGDVPLAALVAHNLLKEAAYAKRENQQMVLGNIPKGLRPASPEDRAIMDSYSAAFEGKGHFWDTTFQADPEIIRSKLQDIRPVYDSHAEDRLGPWYHSFGILFVGTNPAIGEVAAWSGAMTENITRLLNAGSGRSLGKEAANRCSAVLVSLLNRNMEAKVKQ